MAKDSKRSRRGRGEGGVHFDEARKLWVGSVSLGYHTDGRRNRPTVYGATKRECLDGMQRLREKSGAFSPDGATLTVGALLDRWLAANEARIARRTHEDRVGGAESVKAVLGTRKVCELRPFDVEGFHQHCARAMAPSVAWRAARALRAALRHGVKRGYVAASPAADVPVPPLPRREMLTLSQAQARTLLEVTAGYSFLPLLSTALGTGCRLGELLGLGWDALDLDAGTLSVRRSLGWTKAHGYYFKEPKTQAARRTLALPAFVVEALTRHREEQQRRGMLALTVFVGSRGMHRSKSDVANHLKRAIARANAKLAGIPVSFSFHSCRHTHASLLLSQGQSLRAVASRLGHADPAVCLRIYSHVLPGDDARLAAAVGAMLG